MAKIICTQSEYELISQALAPIRKFVPVIYEVAEVSATIPKDYHYDTETPEFYVYRHRYYGTEIHIPKDPTTYLVTQEDIHDSH